MENIVITAASTYDFETLRPFFASLRNSGFKDRTVLFLGEHSLQTYEQLKVFPNLQIIRFSDEYPFFIDGAEKYASHLPSPDFKPHPKTLRYLLTKAYLIEHQNELEYVLTADSRDVVFQKDPFDFDKTQTFYAFQEDDSQNISTNYFNALWIREAFGAQALLNIGDNPILCSGVSIGYIESFLEYLKVMEQYILKIKDNGCKDQGIHNYVIHNNLIENVTIIGDDDGPVSTIASFKPKNKIRIDKNNLVLDKVGNPINIVHQYDRILKLLRHYSRRNYRNKKWGLFKKKYYFLVKPFK